MQQFPENPNPTPYLLNAPGEPMFPSGAENNFALDVDGVTVHSILRTVNTSTIKHSTANNATLTNWTVGVTINVVGLFPTLFKNPATGIWYLIVADFPGGQGLAQSKNLYLYKLPVGASWTTGWVADNGGLPIFTGSSDVGSVYFYVFNAGAWIVNGVLNVLIEVCANQGPWRATSHLVYSSDTLSKASNGTLSLNTNVSDIPVIQNAANPCVVYSSSYSAAAVIYCDLYPTYFSRTGGPAGSFDIRGKFKFAVGYTAGNLGSHEGWRKSPVNIASEDTRIVFADATIEFTPGKTYPSILGYNYAQSTGYQAYLPAIGTVEQLIDSILPKYPLLGNESAGVHIGRPDLYKEPAYLAAPNVFLRDLFVLTGAPFPSIGVGLDGSHLIGLTWDSVNNKGYIQTTGNAYSIVLSSPTEFTNVFRCKGPNGIQLYNHGDGFASLMSSIYADTGLDFAVFDFGINQNGMSMTSGVVSAWSGFKIGSNGHAGVSGTFVAGAKTVTVEGGIITSIV